MTDISMFEQAGEALASSSPEVETVKKLAAEAHSLAAYIKELKELIATAESRWNILKTREIPDAMAAMGSGSWSDEEGIITIKIKDFVSGSLPKDDTDAGREQRQQAIRWLEEHDAADLIKTEVEMTFGKGQHNVAMDLVGRLRVEGHEPSIRSGVHASSLQAYARERLKNGEEVDFELLGLHYARYADVKIVEAQ